MHSVLIGCGAGFADDRTDAAVPIVAELSRRTGPRFLMFETLAERTLALAQLARAANPEAGYSPSLERFLRPVLGDCLRSGIRIVSNFGAANPSAGARAVRRLADAAGFPGIRIAVVEGDEVMALFTPDELRIREAGNLLQDADILSANAYIGAEAIARGFDMGADVVVAGRVADPALALGPLIHAHGWAMDDWDRLAAGTLVGHLLECGAQVSGGYFADPGVKDVPDLAEVGYPIAEVFADGRAVIGKPPNTGGRIDRETVTEQILYEIHDPAAYLTPDVVLDLTEVELRQIAPDRVEITGAKGHPRPETLKATVCLEGGWLAEGEISYAGIHAAARAKLAAEVVRDRMARRCPDMKIRADAIGVLSLFNNTGGAGLDRIWATSDAPDIRLRLAAATNDKAQAQLLVDNVMALYCAGPAAGGGIRSRITPRFASASCYLERDRITPTVRLLEDHDA